MSSYLLNVQKNARLWFHMAGMRHKNRNLMYNSQYCSMMSVINAVSWDMRFQPEPHVHTLWYSRTFLRSRSKLMSTIYGNNNNKW